MEHDATEDLDIEGHHVPHENLLSHFRLLPEDELAGSDNNRESFREKIIEGRAFLDALPEFLCFLGKIGERECANLWRGSSPLHLMDNWPKLTELLRIRIPKETVKEIDDSHNVTLRIADDEAKTNETSLIQPPRPYHGWRISSR
jgi:hypothetical protein